MTAFRAFQTLPEAHRQPIVSGLIRGLSLADLASLREAVNTTWDSQNQTQS